jgi:5,10-methylenetetrahydromethanopterin reductase
VIAAAGSGMAVAYHAMYERGRAGAVDMLPGGAVWREAIESVDERERHLAVHEDHLVATTDRDRAALDAGGAGLLPAVTFTGTPDQLRALLAGLAAAGVTELAYPPAGPDIPGELERMHAALA